MVHTKSRAEVSPPRCPDGDKPLAALAEARADKDLRPCSGEMAEAGVSTQAVLCVT